MIAAEAQVRLTKSPAGLSKRKLATIALAAGGVALAVEIAGSASWLLLGTALAVWSLCGWAIYFRPKPAVRSASLLGTVLLTSAITAALTVLLGLYLIALGPSWIL